MEYYSSSKKNGHACNLGESQNDDAKWKKPDFFKNEDILYIARNPTF